jgi:hypothetical protein
MKKDLNQDHVIEIQLPTRLRPTCNCSNKRIGSKYDGGYEISEFSIEDSDFLLSLGMNEDWRFEKQYIDLKNVPVHLYDHTVTHFWLLENALKNTLKTFLGRYNRTNLLLSLRALFGYTRFTSQANVEHFLEKIVRVPVGSNETSLEEAIKRTGSSKIFLKMDIEGSEFRVLGQVLNSLNKISGLAIEFHDLDMFRDEFEKFMSTIKNEFHINSLNINNFANFSKTEFPRVLEICFSRVSACNSQNDVQTNVLTCSPNNPNGPIYQIRFVDFE